MIKNTLKILATLALATALGQAANGAPQLPGEALPVAKSARPAYSPLPPSLRPGIDILRIRDMRQTGGGGSGGCWTHCFTMYDECLGTKEKNVCVTRIKTCMETCDRLSGISNPTQR
jgi:hypothetical protein